MWGNFSIPLVPALYQYFFFFNFVDFFIQEANISKNNAWNIIVTQQRALSDELAWKMIWLDNKWVENIGQRFPSSFIFASY
jgi:hypothetical protein